METGKIRITTGKIDIRTLTDILNGKYDDEFENSGFGLMLLNVTDDDETNEENDEIEDAYDDGFEEGYDTGYADGYMTAKKEAAHNEKNAETPRQKRQNYYSL